jgi:hypothetical protein
MSLKQLVNELPPYEYTPPPSRQQQATPPPPEPQEPPMCEIAQRFELVGTEIIRWVQDALPKLPPHRAKAVVIKAFYVLEHKHQEMKRNASQEHLRTQDDHRCLEQTYTDFYYSLLRIEESILGPDDTLITPEYRKSKEPQPQAVLTELWATQLGRFDYEDEEE